MIPKSRKILYVCMALLVVAGQVKLHMDRSKRKERERDEHLAAQASPRVDLPAPNAATPPPPSRGAAAVAPARIGSIPNEGSVDAALAGSAEPRTLLVEDADSMLVADRRRPASHRAELSWPADPFWPRDAEHEHETSAGGDAVAPDVKLGDMIPVMEEDSAAVGHDVLDADSGPGSTTANGRAMSEPSEGGAR